jgi:hypothetical protein
MIYFTFNFYHLLDFIFLEFFNLGIWSGWNIQGFQLTFVTKNVEIRSKFSSPSKTH